MADPVLLDGQPVAYDDDGRLVIARQCDDDGSARTLVLNEDGSRKVFGANTVSSLLTSKEVDAKRWVHGLTDRQMRALVHEFGHRLVYTSKAYTLHRKELESLAKQRDYAYFGLSEGATEKDLSVAYRKMAKRMHPDKNGGTDEAKRRFQAMKEKYEHLKEGYRPPQPEEAAEEPEAEPERGREDDMEPGDDEGSGTERRSEDGDEQPCAGREESSGEAGDPNTEDEEQEDGESKKGDKAPHRQEAYDEDEDEARRRDSKKSRANSEDDKRIEYDPHDRSSLDQTVWKMLGQMRHLQKGLDSAVAEIRKSRCA
uniref:J domain-containing protein n=1 Tax=Alexandrium andersonii TaxID=327968 RepID=A0A7S2GJI2_9DINO